MGSKFGNRGGYSQGTYYRAQNNREMHRSSDPVLSLEICHDLKLWVKIHCVDPKARVPSRISDLSL